MRPGQAGPLHAIDTEQIWTVLDGSATVALDGREHVIAGGDTMVIPAGAPRQVAASPFEGFAAIVVASAGLRVCPLGGTTVAAACAVADGDKVIPAWVI